MRNRGKRSAATPCTTLSGQLAGRSNILRATWATSSSQLHATRARIAIMRWCGVADPSNATPRARSAQLSTAACQIISISNSLTSSFVAAFQHSRITGASFGCANLRTSAIGIFRPRRPPLPYVVTISRTSWSRVSVSSDSGSPSESRISGSRSISAVRTASFQSASHGTHRGKDDLDVITGREQQPKERLGRHASLAQ